MHPKAFWVGFNHVKGIGPVRTRNLIKVFGSLEAAWKSSQKEMSAVGLNDRIVESILTTRNILNLEQIWESLEQKNIKVLTWEDEDYPGKLLEIDQPPPVIYYKGTLTSDDDWAAALVGTRRMSVYGRNVTHDIATLLASRKISVVSGLARGIDSVAHQAAIDAGGRTLAVLGCGVDVIYPPENRLLAEQIIAHGALISDYPPGTQPDGINFPPRNRIISGLSQVVIIIEAGEKSGALITAAFAANQGREVFAVPGSIMALQSKGCNKLIRDGARILINPTDILEAMNIDNIPEYKQARLLIPEDAIEKQIASILNDEIMPIDEIQALSGLSADKVSAALVMMELKGMVKQMDGLSYMLARDDYFNYKA